MHIVRLAVKLRVFAQDKAEHCAGLLMSSEVVFRAGMWLHIGGLALSRGSVSEPLRSVLMKALNCLVSFGPEYLKPCHWTDQNSSVLRNRARLRHSSRTIDGPS